MLSEDHRQRLRRLAFDRELTLQDAIRTALDAGLKRLRR